MIIGSNIRDPPVAAQSDSEKATPHRVRQRTMRSIMAGSPMRQAGVMISWWFFLCGLQWRPTMMMRAASGWSWAPVVAPRRPPGASSSSSSSPSSSWTRLGSRPAALARSSPPPSSSISSTSSWPSSRQPTSSSSSSSFSWALRAKIPTLDDWKMLRNRRIQGVVRDHPSIPTGDTITTSPILLERDAGGNGGVMELEERAVVTTLSGSKYRLGTPMMLPVVSRNTKAPPAAGKAAAAGAAGGRTGNKPIAPAYASNKPSAPPPSRGSPASASAPAPQFTTTMKSMPALMREARQKFQLTGEVVGDDDRQYLLTSQVAKSTSGKSRIYKAYLADDDGLPCGDPVLAKLSRNWEAIEREHGNYGRITQSGVARGQFVRCLDYYPTASLVTRKLRDESALVLERGRMDLKRYVNTHGKLNGRELRAAAACAAQCLQAVHTSGLVWTDMKTENFVVLEGGSVRGIDLESAMPVKDNPVDYSPEATPPEFAEAFLDGDGPYFTLEYNYDVWSLGMMLYELATGRGYFDGKAPIAITRLLKARPVIDLSREDMDKNLKDLVQRCLNVDPVRRPNILQILLHPYFLTTGIGPISF